MPKISQRHIKAWTILVPPLDEQVRIVKSLCSVVSDIDEAICTTRMDIDLIREYRTRLIADVVTGKVDVRHLAPTTIEAEQEDLEADLDDEMAGEDGAEIPEEITDADN